MAKSKFPLASEEKYLKHGKERWALQKRAVFFFFHFGLIFNVNHTYFKLSGRRLISASDDGSFCDANFGLLRTGLNSKSFFTFCKMKCLGYVSAKSQMKSLPSDFDIIVTTRGGQLSTKQDNYLREYRPIKLCYVY